MATGRWIGNKRRITLTEAECSLAHNVGRARNASQRGSGHIDGKVSIRPSVEIDTFGALAEYAFALDTGLAWDGKLKTPEEWEKYRNGDGCDVAGVEIKTSFRDDGSLLLQPWSTSKAPAVLILPASPTEVDIVGWINTEEGKQERYWSNIQRPCYAIPQGCLRPVVELYRKLGIKYEGEPVSEVDDSTAEEWDLLLSSCA